MSRRPIVAANWKMHQDFTSTDTWWNAIAPRLADWEAIDVVVAPTALALPRLAAHARGSRTLRVFGQNAHWEASGAFTGEVSVPLLQDAGAHGCLVGHSERRHVFGETDDDVRRKTAAILNGGLDAILCVGETEDERDAGRSESVVAAQLLAALDGLPSPDRLTVAYEPVWAIGTGRRATTAQVDTMHVAVRAALRQRFGAPADGIRILYGGSVKPAGAGELFALPEVDGALVGGASLTADSFAAIVDAAAELAS